MDVFHELRNFSTELDVALKDHTEAERCISTLKGIKTFFRNSLSQKKFSALVMLSQEKYLIESIPDFNKL